MLGILIAGAPAAAALPPSNRELATTVNGFFSTYTETEAVTLDGHENVWVTDGGSTTANPPGSAGLYELTPFPSQEELTVPQTYTVWSPGEYLWLDPAVYDKTGELFVAQSNGREVDIFAPSGPGNECGEAMCLTHSWTSINGAKTCFNCIPTIKIAIDNTNTYSEGRVYLSLSSPENDIELFDTGQRSVDFPATAEYIEGNRLTGTPEGRFGEVGWIALDSRGDLYVVDWGRHQIDEFASNGLFLRTFPAPRAQPGPVGSGGIAVDPTNGNLVIDESNLTEEGEGGTREFDENGNLLGTNYPTPHNEYQPQGGPVVNANGYVYVPVRHQVDIFGPAPPVPGVAYLPVANPTPTGGTLDARVDPHGGAVVECAFEYGPTLSYGTTAPCTPDPASNPPGSHFSSTTDVSASLSGLTTESSYHYRVVVHTATGVKYGADEVYTPHKVVGLATEAASAVTEASAALNGSLLGAGESAHFHFEWGPTPAYGNSTPTESTNGGTGKVAVSAAVEGLAPFTTYHYRVVASDGAGTSYGADEVFTTPPGKPQPVSASAGLVHSDRAVLHGKINPEGAPTEAAFEYVADAEYQQSGYAHANRTDPAVDIGMSKHSQEVTASVSSLQPGTLYHYRVVGENSAGIGAGTDHTFTTFPFEREVNDKCPNAHVRQQTGSALLPDCRAYELVSAANAGGYDVESSIVPGQSPFPDFPNAEDAEGEPQVLYGVHDGGIPGAGNGTNRGVDPYVATRGANGWTTRYVGIPADATPSVEPFSSTVAEADEKLETFAFGGDELCAPCFSDGSRGVPVHLPDGELVQGMAGSHEQPQAEPAGFIGRHLSADGVHLIFGASAAFEPDGEEGSISIYDRNLRTRSTAVVSKLPEGHGNLPCLLHCSTDGIGELDISSDGSRVVVGQLVSEEGRDRFWHLYMNIGDSSESVDLTPATTSGVLFDGMTADGSRVFFTTKDQLQTSPGTPADEDHSPDMYEAEVGTNGTVHIRLISTGSPPGQAGAAGNSDACDPAANTVREHWNAANGEQNCGVVAIAGGAGVAKSSGTVYFLSPEQLESGKGVQSAPNLYVASPGSAPRFVATLESNANAPLPPEQHSLERTFGSFAGPSGVAVDAKTGDIYVLDIGVSIGQGYIFKFNPEGKQILSFGQNGKLTVAGTDGFLKWPTQIAVDNDPSSPSYRDFYVPEIETEHGQYSLQKFSPDGEHIASIPTYFATGVAVSPSTGSVYATSQYFGGSYLLSYNPEGQLTGASYIGEHSPSPEGLAVDAAGDVYVVNGGGQSQARGTTEVYESSGAWVRQLDKRPSYGVAIDETTGNIYVDEGNQVSEFEPSGTQVGVPTGVGVLGGSISLGAGNEHIYVSDPEANDVAAFGPLGTPPDPETDNPLVVDSVGAPEAVKTGDFQTTPSGNDAAFTSTLPLTGYDSGQTHREVYRYDFQKGVECASCNPTSEQASGDASLPIDGLGISNDGRVFFNSTEGLVDRDLNEREDAYEWEPDGYEFGNGARACERSDGCVGLISTGSSPFPARLLGISSRGVDSYFFTRDKLAEEDLNGSTVKIYDARSLGGFPFAPPEAQCKASDECHGPGSLQPGATEIGTTARTPGGNVAPARCRRRLALRHGKCVRPKHRHHKTKHHHGSKGGSRGSAGHG